MNHLEHLKSARILSCYIEKGGIGSGRHKNSIPELEASNFSPEVEGKHRDEADSIFNEKETKKKNLHDEIHGLGNKISKLRKEIEVLERNRMSLANSNMAKTPKYHAIVGVIKKKGSEGRELIKEFDKKQKEYNELND